MKKFMLGCALALSGFCASEASANDFCCAPQYDPCCYDVDFDGFYIGGNLGAISHTAYRNDQNGVLGSVGSYTLSDTNFTGGLQFGYDRQCDNLVYGLVFDWNGFSSDKKLTVTGNHVKSKLSWYSTLRGRTGVVANDTLIYLTGGMAFGRFKTEWSNADGNAHKDETRVGLVGGFGTETQLCGNWTLGGEFLLTHFNDKSHSFTVGADSFRTNHGDTTWVARVLLNYRFEDLCGCW